MDFKDKKVLIMGLGLQGGGVGAARFMAKKGAEVTVTDLKERSELRPSLDKLDDFDIDLVLGGHREKDFCQADLVIKNPSVPWSSAYLKIAEKSGVEVDTAVGIFFELCPCPTIGVTGTKGKSTTASLIYSIFEETTDDVYLAGNISVQPLEVLDSLSGDSLVVLELSSWQLEGLGLHEKSPHVAVVTNIFPDHINRYDGFQEYKEAKRNIVRFQEREDYFIFNYDDNELHPFTERLKSNLGLFSFSLRDKSEASQKLGIEKSRIGNLSFYSKGNFYSGSEDILGGGEVSLKGKHNIYNVLAALSCCKLLGVDREDIRRGIKGFRPLGGRLERVDRRKGVEFYNDTTATNPSASVESIKTLKEDEGSYLCLIVGGEDKKLKYETLASVIEKEVDAVGFLPGTATSKIKGSLSAEYKKKNSLGGFNSLEEATRACWKNLKGKERAVLLLSPAAASFNMFKNEFERGEVFVNAVKNL